MVKVVTMQWPFARVICTKGDGDAFHRRHDNGVAQSALKARRAKANDLKVVTVQMHWV